jgi:hypothetical protein
MEQDAISIRLDFVHDKLEILPQISLDRYVIPPGIKRKCKEDARDDDKTFEKQSL